MGRFILLKLESCIFKVYEWLTGNRQDVFEKQQSLSVYIDMDITIVYTCVVGNYHAVTDDLGIEVAYRECNLHTCAVGDHQICLLECESDEFVVKLLSFHSNQGVGNQVLLHDKGDSCTSVHDSLELHNSHTMVQVRTVSEFDATFLDVVERVRCWNRTKLAIPRIFDQRPLHQLSGLASDIARN